MRKILLFSTLALSACSNGSPVAKLLDQTGEGDAAAAPAKPDLTVSFVDAATVADGKIAFTLEFKNNGAAFPAEYAVKSKALLFPKADYAKRLVGTGIVLETIETTLNLGAGESKTVVVEKALPNTPKSGYFLGVTTNTDSSAFPSEEDGSNGDDDDDDDVLPVPPDAPAVAAHLVESYEGQLNNVTAKLLDLGEIELLIPETGVRGKYDLYHEVQNAAISMDSGTASHSSRNILRVMEGEDAVPPKADWDETISARFLFADLDAGTLSMGAYTRSEVDKVWTAISWNKEGDAAGHNIHVDYYSNSPGIAHLDTGKYVLGVLMNANDRFKIDAYPENNLDLTFMDLQEQKVIRMEDEVWMSINDGEQQSVSGSINGRGDMHDWSYSIENAPAWLKITAKATKWSYNLTIKASASDVTIGMHEIPVKVLATKDGKTFESITNLMIYKNGGPVLEVIGLPENEKIRLDSPGVTVADEDGVKTLYYDFQVKNAGNEDLFYSTKNESAALKLITTGSKKLAPGEGQSIRIKMTLVGTPIPRADGTTRTYFGFQMNSNGGVRYVSLYLEQGVAIPDNDEDDDDDDDE